MQNKSFILPAGRRLSWAPYIVNEKGDVYSCLSWRYLKQQDNGIGYKMVWLTPNEEDGKSRWYFIHRLVAQLYVPNPNSLPEVNHKDRIKTHNFYTNLEWSTHADNMAHARSTGKPWDIRRGDRHWNFGKHFNEQTKAKMSTAKIGVNHPKFKGYYLWEGKRYSSCQELAAVLDTYSVKINRMVRKGLIKIETPQAG